MEYITNKEDLNKVLEQNNIPTEGYALHGSPEGWALTKDQKVVVGGCCPAITESEVVKGIKGGD